MEYKEPIADKDYKVLVRCFTFNQSKYIEDALNGFAMQKTTFPFVCTIVDDCSTDGEQEVIKAYLEKEFEMSSAEQFETEYANITKAQHKSNVNCTFCVYFLKYNHYSKKKKKVPYLQQWRTHSEYEALCEGDDYWINPLKLQNQVAFMDVNPNYSMICSNFLILKNGGLYPEDIVKQDEDLLLDNIVYIGGGYITTASILYRIKVLNNYPECCRKHCVGDYPLQIWCALIGKVRCLSGQYVVYRYMANNSWSSKQKVASIEKLIFYAKSRMNLLESLNDISNRQYESLFRKKEAETIFSLLSTQYTHVEMILEALSENAKRLNYIHRIVLFLHKHHMHVVANVLSFMVIGEYKSAISAIPFINAIRNRYKMHH